MLSWRPEETSSSSGFSEKPSVNVGVKNRIIIIIMKENKKRDKYLDFAKAVEREGDGDTNYD